MENNNKKFVSINTKILSGARGNTFTKSFLRYVGLNRTKELMSRRLSFLESLFGYEYEKLPYEDMLYLYAMYEYQLSRVKNNEELIGLFEPINDRDVWPTEEAVRNKNLFYFAPSLSQDLDFARGLANDRPLAKIMTFGLFSELVKIDYQKLPAEDLSDVLLYFTQKSLREFCQVFPYGNQTLDAVLEKAQDFVHYENYDLDLDLLKEIISDKTGLLDFRLFYFSQFASKYAEEARCDYGNYDGYDYYDERVVNEDKLKEIEKNTEAIVYEYAYEFFDFSVLNANQLLQLGEIIWGTGRFNAALYRNEFNEDSEFNDKMATFIDLYKNQKTKEEKEVANKQQKGDSKNNNTNGNNKGGVDKSRMVEQSIDENK